MAVLGDGIATCVDDELGVVSDESSVVAKGAKLCRPSSHHLALQRDLQAHLR